MHSNRKRKPADGKVLGGVLRCRPVARLTGRALGSSLAEDSVPRQAGPLPPFTGTWCMLSPVAAAGTRLVELLSRCAVRALFVLAGALVTPAASSNAQAQPPASADTVGLGAFVKAHVAVSALRSQLQAELAEPRAKTRDDQRVLREKLRTNTLRVLQANGLTESAFAEWTKRVSVDSTLRASFEAALARASAVKSP